MQGHRQTLYRGSVSTSSFRVLFFVSRDSGEHDDRNPRRHTPIRGKTMHNEKLIGELGFSSSTNEESFFFFSKFVYLVLLCPSPRLGSQKEQQCGERLFVRFFLSCAAPLEIQHY